MNEIEKAAKYYLRHCGLRGTEMQVAQLMKTTPATSIIRMATERGWSAGNGCHVGRRDGAMTLNQTTNAQETKPLVRNRTDDLWRTFGRIEGVFMEHVSDEESVRKIKAIIAAFDERHKEEK